MNCLHSFHLVPRCWAGLQLIAPWRVRLLGCVWFLVLPVRSSAVHYAGEIGWALVRLLCLLSHGEVKRHADSGAVFPFNANMKYCLSLRLNLILYYIEIATTLTENLCSILKLEKHDGLSLQLHADLSVYFRNGHNRWILYPEGSVYSSGLSLRECSFWLGLKKVCYYRGRLRSEFKEIEQWLN